jgi:hypothetical protein
MTRGLSSSAEGGSESGDAVLPKQIDRGGRGGGHAIEGDKGGGGGVDLQHEDARKPWEEVTKDVFFARHNKWQCVLLTLGEGDRIFSG